MLKGLLNFLLSNWFLLMIRYSWFLGLNISNNWISYYNWLLFWFLNDFVDWVLSFWLFCYQNSFLGCSQGINISVRFFLLYFWLIINDKLKLFCLPQIQRRSGNLWGCLTNFTFHFGICVFYMFGNLHVLYPEGLYILPLRSLVCVLLLFESDIDGSYELF